ncbi:MAG: hypothetical protein HY804_06535 [Nitrospinae bacterium]|nr:hypothetical protein [Nitrospinota bacterium]
MAATHVYQPVTYVSKTLEVSIGEDVERFPFNVKVVGDPADPLARDVEHDFLVAVRARLLERWGKHVALMDLRRIIEAAIGGSAVVPISL